MTSTQAQHERRQRRLGVWVGLLLASSVATSAHAQVLGPTQQVTIRDALVRAVSNPPSIAPGMSGVRSIALAPLFPLDTGGVANRQPSPPGRERSIQRKILGGIVGSVAGLFAGGYLGAAIEGDRCHCDDPGLVGALIGAPVGSVAGGILGYNFLF
jgi:hypothetical protein